MAYLRRVLAQMVADERRSVARLELMSPAERARVVEEWNATELPSPDDGCVHERFERRAEETPEAVAVVFEGGELTYARAERPRQPAGAPAPRPGRGPGRARGDLRRAHPGDGGGAPRRAQGGRGVRPARPGVPGGAAALAARGQRARGGAGARLARRALRGRGRAGARAGRRLARLGGRAGDEPRARGAPAGAPGVRDLHLGLHRAAQGGDGHPPRRRAAGRRGPGGLRPPGGRPRPAVRLRRLRRRGGGDLRRAPHGGGAGAAHRGVAGGRARLLGPVRGEPGDGGRPPDPLLAAPAGRALGRGPGVRAPAGHRRRGGGAGGAGGLVRGAAGTGRRSSTPTAPPRRRSTRRSARSPTIPPPGAPSAGRWRTRASTSWTRGAGRCRWGWRESCTSAAGRWRAGTSTARG